MSGNGANPILFNKKKDWTFRTLANPPPPTSDNISFLPYPQPPSKWTSQVITPNGKATISLCVTLEITMQNKRSFSTNFKCFLPHGQRT